MNIAIIGYGRMGQLVKAVAESRGHEVTCIIDLHDSEKFTAAAFARAAVAIEFTTPAAAYTNIRRAWDAGVKVVCGTTGWIDEHRAEVEHACQHEGQTLFWSANFSIGVAICGAVNKYLAQIMNAFPQYEPSVSEVHHRHKADHPSGTALTLAEQIIANIDRKTSWAEGVYSEEGVVKHECPALAAALLRIDSERRGEVSGIHNVVYTSADDDIILTHTAHSRRGFALGAVVAAEYASTHEGLLTMADMIKL